MSAPAVVQGMAHGRPATLEIAGDTLTWRAHRGFAPIAENIVTTVHDVRLARWFVIRHSWAAFAITALGTLWLWREGLALGISGIAIGVGVGVWRIASPRRYLVLDLGQVRLVMRVAATSSEPARRLAERVEHAQQTGEVPASPPMLP